MDFTVAEFLAFARSKPADEGYNFCDANACAIAQFGLATGRPHLIDIIDPVTDFPELGNTLVDAQTWGELVALLEALPAKPSVWLTPQTYVDADVGEYVK